MLDSVDKVQQLSGVLGRYQFFVLFVTQVPYVVVAGTMLCGAFDGIVPNGVHCSIPEADHNMTEIVSLMDFHSLIVDLDVICGNSYISTLLKTSVMVGGVFGATLSGYLADRIGRKPVLICNITGLALFNAAFAALAHLHLSISIIILLILGVFGGGFMVVNLINVTETTSSQSVRLAMSTMNGWPMGMMFMALIGYLTAHWRWFHLVLAVVATLCIVPCYFLHESPRWLVHIGETKKAEMVLKKIAKMNNKSLPPFSLGIKGFASESDQKYNYLTFLKYPKLLILLLALFYSWLASSIISFATYFILDKLIGNRFMNFFFTGLFKGFTGCLPLALSKCVGRKPVLIMAVACTCAVCWACVIIYFVAGGTTLALTILTVVGAGCIDPIWKINHFYSAELFPVVVRNMARAFCNIGSRAGSVIGPQVAHLREVHIAIPYIVFGIISTIHLLICTTLLPETKGKPVVDNLPGEEKFEEQNHKDVLVEKVTKV